MAFIVPSTVSDGQVLTDTKWNQDVVENTTRLYYTSRIYQSSARTSDLVLSATPTNVFATGVTIPVVSGSVYCFWVNFTNVYTTLVVDVDLVLTGAVSLTSRFFDAGYDSAGTAITIPVTSQFWWTATATGNVTANLQAYGTGRININNSGTDNSVRLRASGPMLIA